MTKRKQDGRYEFDQFLAIRRHQGNLAFSPDGSQIAYIVNTSGQFNVWRQPTEGGYPIQLTAFTQRTTRGLGWSPDGETIAFFADQQGDEFHQLYLVDAGGGWPEQLTHQMDVQHHLASKPWSPDGRQLLVTANDRDRTAMDVLLRDVTTGEAQRLLAGDTNYFGVNWSPGGRRILAIEYRLNTDIDTILINLEDGSHRTLTEHEGQVIYMPGPWLPDGSGFYMITDEGREFKGLAFYDLETDGWEWVETPEWDVEGVALSEDGHYLAWLVNENGYTRLYVRDRVADTPVELPELPLGVVTMMEISPDGRYLACYLTSAGQAVTLYVLDIEAGELRQLTQSMLGGIDPVAMVEPELAHFESFDGRRIPAWLYRPHGASADDPVPAVLSIHGGPEAQERPMYLYSGLYQYLLNRGIAVLAPNIRGSTGYGKSYQRLIHRDWGGGELQDIEAAAKYLGGIDWVDADRLAVFGGSFGGFATLSAVSRLPDYWAAAVDIVGPANLITFVKSVPPFWRRFMEKWVGDPEKDRELLIERSPITYVDQIKAPLFVIQGANDPRVVKAESDQMVERLRERGVPVRYDVYQDEGHGFTKRENEQQALKTVATFLEEHLLEPDES